VNYRPVQRLQGSEIALGGCRENDYPKEQDMKSRISTWILFALIAVAVVMGTSTSAYADTTTLNLNQSEAFGAGSYGTVKLTLITSGVNTGKIQVEISLTNGSVIVDTGTHKATAWNENLAGNPALTVTSISDANYTFANAGGTASSFNMDGAGTYEFALSGPSPSGGSGAVGSLTFIVGKVSGSFTTVNDLLENSIAPPGTSSLWAVDILRTQNCTGACTGVVYTTGGTTNVPEPTSILLLGSSLIGLGLRARKLRKQ